MPPELLLATLKSGFDFGTELLKFWQTPEGQKAYALLLSDRAAWDKFWGDLGTSVQKLFSGELFKQ